MEVELRGYLSSTSDSPGYGNLTHSLARRARLVVKLQHQQTIRIPQGISGVCQWGLPTSVLVETMECMRELPQRRESDRTILENIARGTTDPEIDSVTWIKLGNNMAPLTLVANLTT